VELQEELKLLNSIDKVKDLPVAIRDLVGQQMYLEAAQDVVQGLQMVNGKLREVGGEFFFPTNPRVELAA
jgi:hypothetical protein